MVKFLNENCRNAENLMKKNLKNQIGNSELEQFFEINRGCQDASGESRKIKNLLRRAVEKEFAPQGLIDSIRQGIRR